MMETRVLEKKETRFRDAEVHSIRDDKVEFAGGWCVQIWREEDDGVDRRARPML